MPLIERVCTELGARVSVDTYKPAVAAAAIAAGASIVNDVSGLRDPELADVCAQTGAALVVMHTIAEPKRRLHDRSLDGLMAGEVRRFLEARIELAVGRGRRVRAAAARSRAGLLQDAGADDRGAARAAGADGARPAGAAGGVTQGLHRRPDRPRLRASGWRDAGGGRLRRRRRRAHAAAARCRRRARVSRPCCARSTVRSTSTRVCRSPTRCAGRRPTIRQRERRRPAAPTSSLSNWWFQPR